MRSSKRLINLIVIVFLFLLINFVTLKDFSSRDEKPMIVVKEYYYYNFGGMEIRDPRDLNGTQLKEFKFEEVDIKSHTLYKFIGKNETDYEIYIGDVFVNKDKKTADLELITVKEYENLDEISFEEIKKILYDADVIELKVRAFKKFVGEGIVNNQGGYGNYYKLPLIYCMVENCNIGVSEDKRLLILKENFASSKKITKGPYSAQTEEGQVIVWRTFENYGIGAEESGKIDTFLYIVNASKRGSDYGGGFNIDKTFMREPIDILTDTFSKKFYRDMETLEERFNHFIGKIDYIIGDKIAKWSVMPFLWARYKNYILFHGETKDFFAITSGIYPEDTKTEFEYNFIQEFGTEEDNVRELVNSQIDYIYNKIKQNHEYYRERVIEKYNSQIKDFDNVYFSIAAIWGLIIGVVTFFWKITHRFWESTISLTIRSLIIAVIIFCVVYILLYDIFVIHNINIEGSSILITDAEKNLALLFSLVVAGLWALWSFRDQISTKILKKKKRKVITLCGSTKFKKEYEEWNKKLTLEGNVVLSCGVFAHADDIELTDEQKRMLDEIHIRKIDMSDEIFVLNVDGRIGESTQCEINYARKKGKKVGYLEELGNNRTEDDNDS